jgi:outer membrane protein
VPVVGASSVRLEILVPLLRGLGAESAGAAEAAARGDAEVARLLYRHTLASQAFATVSTYWSARAATESLAVQRDVEERAVRLYDSINVLVSSRVFAPIFLIQAEANRRDKGTQRRNAELNEVTARFNFGRMLGLPPEQMAATPVPADKLPEAAAAYEQLAEAAFRSRAIQRALAARADYLAFQQSERPLNILTRQAELDLRPRVDLNVGAGYQGFDASRNPLTPLHERVTGGNATVGLSFDWPTRNIYQQGLLRERRASVRQAEANTAELASGIAADVLTVLEEVRLRAQTALTAAATVDTAERAVKGQQDRLRSGESTVLDVINLENLATSSRLQLIEARTGYAIAVARLRYTLGAIFTADSTDRSFKLHDLTTPTLSDEK